jgi:putative tryptophan/tyrosine transport system substrate-binding protein
MIAVLKKLALGLGLIALAAAILLYSDLESRHVNASGPSASRQVRVAFVQQTSTPALDDGVLGALAALRDRGYVDGGRMVLRHYNAQGDISNANAIAKEVTTGDFDLISSFSTISLQTIANANRFATPPRKHVFALVSDPYAVGVGINPNNHAEHPPYMTGIGSLAPVEDIFRTARKMRPSLKRVGLVWDPGEANSVITTKIARQVCAKMGIELIEANAESTTLVGEAAGSLLARKIDAIWVSPDLVTTSALDVIVAKARTARIPVFTSMPHRDITGALFEMGADYFALGRLAGDLDADVLDGRNPASVPVENIMPVRLHINKTVLANLRERWDAPEDLLAQANVVIDATGRHEQNPTLAAAK